MSPNVEHAAVKDPPVFNDEVFNDEVFNDEVDEIDPELEEYEVDVDVEPQMSSSPVHTPVMEREHEAFTPVMEHEAFGTPISPVTEQQEVLY